MIDLMLVPHTWEITGLSQLVIGDAVNIEFDYVTRIMAHQLRQLNMSTQEVTQW